MQVFKDGSVIVEQGEVIPVCCDDCGAFYQPTADSLASRCRRCGYGNLHWEQQVTVRGVDDGANTGNSELPAAGGSGTEGASEP